MKKTFLYFFIFLNSLYGYSQQLEEIELAQNYFIKGDVEKSYTIYKSIDKKIEIDFYYEEYRTVLLMLNKYTELNQLLSKIESENIKYKVDKALVIAFVKDQKASTKLMDKIINEAKIIDYETEKLAKIFVLRDLNIQYMQLINDYRAYNNIPSAFAVEKAQLHFKLKQNNEAINELLIYISEQPAMISYVQEVLQDKLQLADYTILEDAIYNQLSTNDNYIFNELLAWMYMQQRAYQKAFLEYKSLDTKRMLEGDQLFQFGEILFYNKNYTLAEQVFTYITNKYPTQYISFTAKSRVLNCREQTIKNTFPVDTLKVKQLIIDLEHLASTTNRINDQADITRSIAYYNAFYLMNYDKATKLLLQIVNNPKIAIKTRTQAKLDLADIYVYNQNEWEAILLYDQVVIEAQNFDTDLAHQAKLKTAKVYYYMSDFELAKEYLEILKLATSREIANDALDLAILIQDNLGLDTSKYVLSKYAFADKLVMLHQYNQSLEALQNLYKEVGVEHAISDEILWLQSKIYKQLNNTSKSKETLLLITEIKSKLYSDDAIYNLAQIAEYENDIELAKQYYKSLLIDYPGSIFVSDARKKYRSLRGDKSIN